MSGDQKGKGEPASNGVANGWRDDHPAPVAPEASRAFPPSGLSADVSDFLRKMRQSAPPVTQRGRLIFAMDATMSRQPTWDMALGIQADMFDAVARIGGLDVQLVYFRGAGECRASKWVANPADLARLMGSVACRGGYTQIGKVLSHALSECGRQRIGALVYVGDSMEEEVDDLCGRAGLGVPAFLFQEGDDARATQAFAEIARLTRGATCRFGHGSPEQLSALLGAVATYAAGGRRALEALADGARGGTARRLLADMTRSDRVRK